MGKRIAVALVAALSVAGVTAVTTSADREIVVQPGDSLQTISARFYGDDEHIRSIASYNGLLATQVLYPGQRLRLPELPPDGPRHVDVAASAAVSSAAQAAAVAGEYSRVVPWPAVATPAPPPASAPSAPNPTGAAAADHAALPGLAIQSGLATWYGPGFDGALTYCGDIFDEWAYTAASNTLPCGLMVVVTNRENGASVRVRINDRGGFGGAVIMDLSRAAFGAIASWGSGVISVTVSEPAETPASGSPSSPSR